MRRGGHRSCKASVETFIPSVAFQSEPAHLAHSAPVAVDELAHFRRLARIQGIEAAAKAFTKEELLKLARVNGFTYINPRARKIDLAHALAAHP